MTQEQLDKNDERISSPHLKFLPSQTFEIFAGPNILPTYFSFTNEWFIRILQAWTDAFCKFLSKSCLSFQKYCPKQPLQYSCMNAYVFSIIIVQNFYFFFVAMITPETSPTGQTHFPTISFSFPFLFNGFRNTRFEFFTNDFAPKNIPSCERTIILA